MKRIVIYIFYLYLFGCTNVANDNSQIEDVNINNDGDTLSIVSYDLDGRIHGLYKSFCEGKVDSVLHYKNGVKHGEYLIYYRNGTIKEEGSYIDGIKLGWSYSYRENGNLFQIVEYLKGAKPQNNWLNQVITFNKKNEIDRSNSRFYKIGLLENLKKGDTLARIRIQFYPTLDTIYRKVYATLYINKNNIEKYKLHMIPSFKRDFIVPIHKDVDLVNINGYVNCFYAKCDNDSIVGEANLVFIRRLDKLKLFKETKPRSLPFLPINYDTLIIE